jgi:hypothetical protein
MEKRSRFGTRAHPKNFTTNFVCFRAYAWWVRESLG